MIIIICDDFLDAQQSYMILCDFLSRYEPFSIVEQDPYSLRIKTDDDLVYIFIDYHLIGVFEGVTEDVIERAEFFEDLYSNYNQDVIDDFNYGWIPW